MHGFAALLGALIGYLAANGPEFIQMLKDRFAHQRTLEQQQQALDAASKGYEFAIRVQGEAAEKAAEKAAATIQELQGQLAATYDARGHFVLQFLRSSVRPLVTYGFFAVFAAIKISALHHGYDTHEPLAQLLPLIWDEDTESLFAAVITFWFGSRSANAVALKKDSGDETKVPTSTLTGTAGVVGE